MNISSDIEFNTKLDSCKIDCFSFSNLKRLPWFNHIAFKIDPKIEGYKNFVFGGRAGPDIGNGMNVLHEMSHAIQFGANCFKSRTENGSFVFKQKGSKYLFGQYIYEPTTNNCSLRELETFAIQLHIYEYLFGEMSELDYKNYVYDISNIMKYLPDVFEMYRSFEPNIELTHKYLIEFYKKWDMKKIEKSMNSWLKNTQIELNKNIN